MSSPHVLQIGDHLIDLLDPDPEKIDPIAVIRRLSTIRRFGGEPRALTVLQHQELVGLVALSLIPGSTGLLPGDAGYSCALDCFEWGRRHDLHEGVIGDIVSPVARLIDQGGAHGLKALKARIDWALSREFGFIPFSARVRDIVHQADQIASAIEWCDVMRRPSGPWICKIPLDLSERQSMVAIARRRAAVINSAALVGDFIGYQLEGGQ